MPAMSEPADLNPYAPPQEDSSSQPRRARKRRRAGDDIQEALARLDDHLADPERVREDLAAAGPRVRVVTIVISVLATASLLATVVGKSSNAIFAIGVGASVIFGILAVILLVLDLSLVPYGQTSTPEAALKSFFKSMGAGRFGYAWARLCPTAREQRVETPQLGIDTTPGEFTLTTPEDVKSYLGGFARPGGNQVRTMSVKRITVASVQDDVAVVEAELSFQSWPRWVSIVMAIGFVVFRPTILVGIILYFILRKQHKARISKTLLRGRDGAWYVYDADLLEGADA